MLIGVAVTVIGVGTLGLAPQVRAIDDARGEAIVEPRVDAGRTQMRILTETQYRNTIAAVFGPDIEVATRFAPVQRTNGLLALGTTTAGVSPSDAEAFHRVAYAIAGQVTDERHRKYLVGCRPSNPEAADPRCTREFFGRVGRLLYRRPLSQAELQEATDTAGEAAGKFKDFYTGLSYALGAMLTNPKFLFVIEQSEPDPATPGQRRLTAYSLATRLSLMLWNAAPDEDLLAAAGSGKLYDPRVRAQQIDAMIASPRFEAGMRAFFSDMLAFEDFANLAKDASIYPNFTGRSAQDSAEQTLKVLVDHVIDKDADYRDIFTTRTTFLTPSLAPLYGSPAPSTGWARYDLPADSDRRGLLMQIGFLAAHSHPGRSSPTKRGKALRELLMCQPVPDPPPNVDFSIVEDPNAKFKNARERITAHRADPGCAGCHRLTDPMGLALENFDGAGQFRNSENGAPIDTSGELDGVSFKDVRGLSEAVRDNPATTACLVKRTFAYALGRAATRTDTVLLKYLEQRFATNGFRVKALIRALAMGEAISNVASAG